jgi:hypothetical protein
MGYWQWFIRNTGGSAALWGMDHVATSIDMHGPLKAVRVLSATQLAIEFEDGHQTAVPVPAAFVEGAVQAASIETNGCQRLRLRFASGFESVHEFAVRKDAAAQPALVALPA